MEQIGKFNSNELIVPWQLHVVYGGHSSFNECTWFMSAEPSPLHACMTHARVWHGSLCMLIQYQKYYIPCTWTWLWYCSSPFRVSAWSIVGGRHQAMSLYKLKASKLDYAFESHCLFTLSLHWQLTSKVITRKTASTRIFCNRLYTSVNLQFAKVYTARMAHAGMRMRNRIFRVYVHRDMLGI